MNKQNLVNNEILGSFLLIFFALLALIINNTSLSVLYNHFLDINLSIKINDAGIDKPLLLWINDGLMAVFFLLVGLELKREVLEGELNNFKEVILPVIGSIGGMLFPILIYYLINMNTQEYMDGWAVPMATDIAFALGILALFGRRVPIQLKLFLLTLAIIDDLGAILVIGIYHTKELSWQALGYAQLFILALIILNLTKAAKSSIIYLMIGLALWVSTLQSGFHATIAGVILAFTIPLKTSDGRAILHNLENDIKPLVTFFILPVFAFANSGIPFDNIRFSDIFHPVVMGISAGLIVGNFIGISILTLLTKKLLNIKTTYSNTSLLGVTLLCGIGFTMSLFISGLSFSNNQHLLNLSRLGIIMGSFLSMIIGSIILHYSLPKLEKT